MISGLFLTSISIIFLLYAIWITDRNKVDTLSLYSMLKLNQIRQVYDKCGAFLDTLETNIFSFELVLIISYQSR